MLVTRVHNFESEVKLLSFLFGTQTTNMPKTKKTKSVTKDTPVSICVHKSKKCKPTKLCTKCMTSLISNLSRAQRHNSQETRRWMTDMQTKFHDINNVVKAMEEALHQLEAAWADMEDTDVDSDEVEILDLRPSKDKDDPAYWDGYYD